MNELKISSGSIRMYTNEIQIIHSTAKKKRRHLEDITIPLKEIHHVELYKPRWPFSKGYIRFSLDGSYHVKKDSRSAGLESFSMLCSTMKEYKKLEKIKRDVETEIEALDKKDMLPPNEVKQIEQLIKKIHNARKERKTGRQKRLISELENKGIEVELQEEKILWKLKKQA
ncbi:hypothetical protein GCM10011571_15820 [Marinithermofilum abyssi]|uniref:Uncharacterized protein n=1 Tax=Marinithermofilum abyssi TaxID=1571185 RepID=A0A8J2VEZ4_9BACL|nr:hypothetical protein [Marinithermofilum abyssi]GGE15114.1 hypothetical protein GCM10011571_15820 [Marinithermofilum abyssi]